jgi:hypothetical protein
MNVTEKSFWKQLNLKQDTKVVDLLWAEQLLLQAIGYHTHVHTPYTSVKAIFKLLGLGESEEDQQIRNKSLQFVLDSFRSKKVVFCFSPAETALAAVQQAYSHDFDVVA